MIDDHSRLAYVEICADEKAITAIDVLQRAVAWLADHGVTVERVLSHFGEYWLYPGGALAMNSSQERVGLASIGRIGGITGRSTPRTLLSRIGHWTD